MDAERNQYPLRRLYDALVGSTLFWLLVPFLLLAQMSSCFGIYHREDREHHPAEPGWSQEQCLRELRAPIFDRNPDMLDLPEDVEFRIRQECTDHAEQHVRP